MTNNIRDEKQTKTKKTLNKTGRQPDALRIPTREKLHRHFGGLIYPSDFATDYHAGSRAEGSFIAARILADRRREETFINGHIYTF